MLTPPTDSLYKFIAIAGIVMVLWGAAFPWNKANEYGLQAVELRSAIKATGEKSRILQLQYDQLTQKGKTLTPQSQDYAAEKQAIENHKMKLYLELLATQNPVDIKSEKLKVLEEAQITYRNIGWASLAAGILFTLVGFFLWYTKIQRHVDAQTANPNRNT